MDENPQYLLACTCLLIGATLWAGANVLTSLVSEQIPRFSLIFTMYAIGAILLLPIYRKETFSQKRAKPFFLQLLFLTVAELTGAFAFTLADPNNVVAIFSLNTFAIPCLSFWIFRKTLNCCLMLPCAVLTFSGVLFIIQPSFIFSHSPPITTYHLIGYGLIFISMCTMSLFVSYQRVEPFHGGTMTFWACFVISTLFFLPAISGLPMLFQNHLALGIVFIIGAFVSLGYWLCLYGWQIVDASTAAMFYQIKVPMVLFLSILVGLEAQIDTLKIVGVAMIVGGIIAYQFFNKDDYNINKKLDLSSFDEEI